MATSADLAYLDDLATLAPPPASQVGQGTYLASGGGVAYSSGLSFRVSTGTAYINFALVPFASVLVTIGAADVSNPRIDAIVVDNTGALSVVAGTAAATPSTPNTDSLTQLVLSYVLVPTGASTLAITLTDIYKENTEWTSSVSGAAVSAASASNPFAGTKDTEFTAAASGDYVRYTNASLISVDSAKQLVFQIRSKATWPNPKSVQVTWYAGGVKVGQSAALASGRFGFNSSTTGSYQQIVIPMVSFAIPAGTTVDRVEFKVNGGGGTIGFYLDNVVLESNSTVATQQPTIKESDLPISAWVPLTDGATITWDVSKKREAKGYVTLGGNRALSIVGAVNGSAGIIKVTQDGTGSRGLTLPAGSIIVGGGGTTAPLSTAAGSIDLLAFEYDGTSFLWTYGKALA